VGGELIAQTLAALGARAAGNVRVTGTGSLPSAFRVSELAVASVAAAGVCLDELLHVQPAEVSVDRDLVSHWFGLTIRPCGWQLPQMWDAIAGDYRTTDGWIRLHTNAPHHRLAALDVLDVAAHPARVAEAVRGWSAGELERAVVTAGGAAAAMRSAQQWRRHPQGVAVAAEPLVAVERSAAAGPLELPGASIGRPLQGIRVLDLTRVLAGPVGTRLLAGWGADVLRIDPPKWDEPGVIPEVLRGKRTARLDLAAEADRDRFRDLLAGADVLVHGYRADALDRLGFGAQVREQLRPGLVDVALDAYGWTGPWARRRGFDSLVQMSTGIVAEGMRALGRDKPTPLPVQALDHATGYLMAAAALRGLAVRRDEGRGSRWRLSLARTAALLADAGPAGAAPEPAESVIADGIEQTAWGPARRVAVPLHVADAPLRWALPARALGADPPTW
jgi:hypothetical protein